MSPILIDLSNISVILAKQVSFTRSFLLIIIFQIVEVCVDAHVKRNLAVSGALLRLNLIDHIDHVC